MLRLVALSTRCRLLRAGAVAVSAPRASCLAAIDGHLPHVRFFSSQKIDDGNDDTHGPQTKLAFRRVAGGGETGAARVSEA